jgi:hypothetical protein
MLAPAAVLVAVVAGGGGIGVTPNAAVLTIGAGLGVKVVGMAVDAGEAGVVSRNLMAIVANRTVMRDGEVGVIESGAQPAGGGMAGITGRRVARCDVVRDTATESLGAGPRSLMAPIAGRVRGRKAVIVVDVAGGAGSLGRIRVRAGECPTGGGVVEGTGIPSRGVVASGAERSWEARGDMVWNSTAKGLRIVPLVGMAADASGVGGGQIVIVVDVAVGARRGDMRARQREASTVVIEIGGAPTGGGVAIRAIGKSEGRACS